jgi:hypothetical protein
MARERNGHAFTAISVRGGILPAQFLSRVAALKASQQTGPDYGLSKSLNLKDEIARYWRIANDLFSAYQERRLRKDLDSVKVGADEWLVLLLRDVFGYKDLSRAAPIEQGERRFPITHHAFDGAVPLVLTTADVDLDRADARFGDDGRKRAAHNLMQELLNAGDQRLWGIISNGETLRLLHDNPSLSRPAYLEADLEQMFSEQLYSDFAALWLLAHASRLRPSDGKEAQSILEAWRAQAHEEGERALGQLRDGVTQALLALGNGFLEHPANDELRIAISDGSITADSYFQELLRLVYRLLFLFAAEERDLLHPSAATDDQRRLYREGYALARLRDRAQRRRHYDRHADLWSSLRLVFTGLMDGQSALGLPGLAGLFARDQCPQLDRSVLSNARLLEAVRALAYFRTEAGLTLVNYRDMGAEELGSVYESLLELQPVLNVDVVPWSFDLVGGRTSEVGAGSARKLTGSYYTPTPLVNELVRSALEPVMTTALEKTSCDPSSALLELKVLDPACGSGHFLLAAARRLAAEIARVEAGSDTPGEVARQHALRMVVQHCLYGVDRNPLAVELCKAALWIEAIEPGKPLSFLDSHILCGDSLVGILRPEIMAGGIPDIAYQPIDGDEVTICRELKRRNRQAEGVVQGSLFDQGSFRAVVEADLSVDAMPEETLLDVVAKRLAWEKAQVNADRHREELRAHLFVSAFFISKTRESAAQVPLTEDLSRLDRGMPMRVGVEDVAKRLATHHRFFHWHIAFPEIMGRGGFDVVLGNPPWEQLELDPRKFFTHTAPEIADSQNLAETLAKVETLKVRSPKLYAEFQEATHSVHAQQAFIHGSGRYPLTSYGRLNLAPLFAELALQIVRPGGRAGLVLPSSIATDSFNQHFFKYISDGRIVQLLDFENRERLFPAVHIAMKFCLLILGQAPFASYSFFLTQPDQARDSRRRFALDAAEIARLNPNTGTCPVFRSAFDADLTKKIYRRVPVLWDETSNCNPWNLKFVLMFMMHTDSKRFLKTVALEKDGARRAGSRWIDREGEEWLPLFEAKMVDFYDHRAATYESRGGDRGYRVLPKTTDEQHKDPCFEPQPFYWVKRRDVQGRLPTSWVAKWLFGYKEITSPTNERTMISCVMPLVGAGHTLPLLISDGPLERFPCLVGNMSSIVLDYIARQKVGGVHLSAYCVKQLPIIPPLAYTDEHIGFIVPRVIELTYTSETMRAFAADYGFEREPYRWHADRRQVLRAELDAYFARLYGLDRDELRCILDPSDVLGPDYPSETFRVLKDREIRQFGEYSTARRILEAWDRIRKPPHPALGELSAV